VADKRSGFTFLTSNSLVMTGSGLCFGALLSTKNASLVLYNSATATAVPLSSRMAVLSTPSTTGHREWSPTWPVQASSGLFASISSGAVATVFYSTRN